jgi:hypothetical protein
MFESVGLACVRRYVMLTIIVLTVLGLGQGSGLQYFRMSAAYESEATRTSDSPRDLDQIAEVVVRGTVTKVSSQFTNDTIWSRAEVSVETVEKGTAVTKVVVEYEGGRVGDIELVVSSQPRFGMGEHVLLYLVRGTGDNFRVAGGPAGKILLDSSGRVLATGESGYIYTGLHWPSGNVGYYVNAADGPAGALSAVQKGFGAWNNAGAAFSFTYGGGGNTVRWAYYGDGPGGTLAVTYIWASSHIVYSCETVFDSAESWATDGSANKFDVWNVAAHEAGHWLVLGDLYEPQYSEMTMYGYASLGETKKRTLAWGDIAGIQFIYPGSQASITVTGPVGGDSWQAGSAYAITWASTGSCDYVNIWYNTGSGWVLIAAAPNTGSYQWIVPNAPSTSARVGIDMIRSGRVVATGYSGYFTITGSAPPPSASITVTSPAAGVSWQAGLGQSITWTATGACDWVNIWYDVGGGWVNIAFGAPNTGSYQWIVPNAPSTSARVGIDMIRSGRVVATGYSGYFTITGPSPPSITVTSPVGGDSWQAGSTHAITWASTGSCDYVNIWYNTGSGWVLIAAAPNTGSYQWIVPNAPSANVRVGIDMVRSGAVVATGYSGYFTITG